MAHDGILADESSESNESSEDTEASTRHPPEIDTPARELLFDLVTTPSVSGEERAAAEVLVSFFESHDREVWLDDVGNVRAPAVGVADHDATPAGDVLLTSHLDTVPGEVPVRVETVASEAARWGGEAVESDGVEIADLDGTEITDLDGDEIPDFDGADVPELWGRGSVDATGPLAAMAVAAVETGASFVGVVGEETDSRGARHLVAERDAPAAVINGEPSGWDGVTLGYRGFLAGTYTASTDSTHSSRPEPNAIQHATAWCERAAGATEDLGADGGTNDGAVFESVTAKPVGIDGGLSEDGHSVEATVEIQFRIPPGVTGAEIREAVAGVTEHGTLDWNEPIPPATASPRTDLARAFRVAVRQAGGEPRLLRKTGTADTNLYAAAWDCPAVTYGPGDAALDHTPEERLPLPELDRAVTVLTAAVERLR
jgi:LysW-gamma-L-lysine carboxypeptidase